ncbi:Hypp6702 [Branchiostoma lanceolatum]|uniref:Hypp6702 protein n=1 Tax=Branchiostoma lanceolatum TaxID=7740 RepID=A0A8J9YVE6_BRALA|nr:Hypp6702 [Branchiostoma lanceolatum]
MRGEDATTADIPLFDGTAKSAEGYGFELIWDELRSDGFELHVHWQDGDSSSEKSFDTFFPNGKVMYCGGHVSRAHGKQLETLSKMKTFTPDFMKRHSTSEWEYKELEKLKCHCEPRHKGNCGCLSPKTVKQMKINHFAALVQSGNEHTLYARRMQDLGKYHARNIHQWEGGKCDFHGERRCTCKKCSPADMKCTGEPYSTCPFHSKAYEIECYQRAKKSADVIHPQGAAASMELPFLSPFLSHRRKIHY